MNAKPKTTRTNPATFSSRNWSREETPADERRADSEQHEDRREAEDEGHARGDHTSRVPRLAELVRVDGGDCREVPGTSGRTHGARNDTNPGQKRDRDRRQAQLSISLRTGRAPRRPGARGPGRAGARRPAARAGGSTGGRAGRRRRARDASATSGRSQASEPEAALSRRREHARAELGAPARP